MVLDDFFRNATAYVAFRGTSKKVVPQGTAFFLRYADDTGDYTYAVTAAHIFDGAPLEISLWFCGDHERRRSIPARKPEWIIHPTADVAITRVDPTLPVTVFSSYILGPSNPWGDITAGRRVLTIGLFAGELNFQTVAPIARFGHISRTSFQAKLKFGGDWHQCPDHTLIECLSWGGQSGSPVFCIEDQRGVSSQQGMYDFALRIPSTDHITDLNPRIIGLLHGNYHIPYEVSSKQIVNLNSGISVVVPWERIKELLESRAAEHERIKDGTQSGAVPMKRAPRVHR